MEISKKEKIRLYLGYAPGKTTALNGVVLRALGAGLRVKLILFSKCAENSSESCVYDVLKKHFPNQFNYFFAGVSRIRSDGTFRYFGDKDGWTLEDKAKLDEGVKQLSKDLKSGEYDILCIDELTDLIYHEEKRIDEDIAKNMFCNIHENITVIVTGHLCPDWLKNVATTVIEGKALKHYKGYTKGIEW